MAVNAQLGGQPAFRRYRVEVSSWLIPVESDVTRKIRLVDGLAVGQSA